MGREKLEIAATNRLPRKQCGRWRWRRRRKL